MARVVVWEGGEVLERVMWKSKCKGRGGSPSFLFYFSNFKLKNKILYAFDIIARGTLCPQPMYKTRRSETEHLVRTATVSFAAHLSLR